MIVLYMIVFHADFVFVTLGRLRRRLHTGIKDLLFCLAVVHEKNGLKKTVYPPSTYCTIPPLHGDMKSGAWEFNSVSNMFDPTIEDLEEDLLLTTEKINMAA